MKIPEHMKDVKSYSLNKSRYFSPTGKFVLDSRFPESDFWDRLFELPLSQHHRMLTASNFAEVSFDPNTCYKSASSTTGANGRRVTTRKNCRLPETENHPSKVYRISPRTVYFYLEFGCLRQVKTACVDKECINPYHQIPESMYERDEKGSVNASVPYNQRYTFNNFVVGMSLSDAINMVNDAGHTDNEISQMPLQDFINIAMAHREYTTRLKREVPTEQAIVIAGRK